MLVRVRGCQNFGGMIFYLHVVPDLLDFAVGADQERAADDPLECAAHEFFAAPYTVGFKHFVFGVA